MCGWLGEDVLLIPFSSKQALSTWIE
jgi:hypothetical protein